MAKVAPPEAPATTTPVNPLTGLPVGTVPLKEVLGQAGELKRSA